MEETRSTKNMLVSIVLKSVLIIVGLSGLAVNLLSGSFMGNAIALLYFTIQSNITITAIVAVFLVFEIIAYVKGKNYITNGWKIAKYAFTVAIMLTFLVFFVVLLPNAAFGSSYIFSYNNMSVHLLVPLLALADFLIFDKDIKFKKSEPLYGTAMPIYYLIFSLICSVCGVKFGTADMHVPYFFLDYKKLGWFSFENGMGVVYWVILLTGVVIGIGYALAFFAKLCNKKKKA